jgi:hypothetical protein
MEEVQVQNEEASSPEMTNTSDLIVTGSGKLQEKLRELLALRAEIDLDIEALKRAVNIILSTVPSSCLRCCTGHSQMDAVMFALWFVFLLRVAFLGGRSSNGQRS